VVTLLVDDFLAMIYESVATFDLMTILTVIFSMNLTFLMAVILRKSVTLQTMAI
jgi:hypothetical protein